MNVFVTSKNTGPSWNSDPVHLLGVFDSEEKAVEVVPEDFRRYEVELDTQFNRAQDRHAFPHTWPSRVIRHWMADGWWYSVSEHEVK